MTKEFETIKDDKLRIGLLALKRLVEANKGKMSPDEIMAFDFTFMNITNALLELQAIKEAKPSEALECLEVINNYGCGINDNMKFSEVFEKEYNTIKQALEKRIVWKHIHNTKVKVPLIQIFNGKTQGERHQIIEDIYYNWEEKKEVLEDKIQELEKENTEYKKAWNIAVEKNVNFEELKGCKSVIGYNFAIRFELWKRKELTEEEFDLLKEVM